MSNINNVQEGIFMEGKNYVNYSKKGRKGETFYKEVKKAVDEFFDDSLYQISDYECRPVGVHIEASYLCQGIWNRVMENKLNEGNPQSNDSFYWSKEAGKELKFHFDIMTNPNEFSYKLNGRDVKKVSCGLAKMCDKEIRENWESVYHTIGNMAPIPWFGVDGDHYIDGQMLHNALDERWDLYLKILQASWETLSGNVIDFNEYMILTCQHMYYEKVYEEIEKETSDKKLEEYINTITYDKLETWKEMINKNDKLISFSISKDKKANDVVNMIIMLIKIRCKIIQVKYEKVIQSVQP